MATLQEGRIVTRCVECENPTEVWDDDTRPLCEWCSHAEECPTPKKIYFGHARLTGEYRAYCRKCNYVSAYFECGCDLTHNCKDWQYTN